MFRAKTAALLLGLLALGSCRFDPAYRDFPEPLVAACTEGVVECRGSALVRCEQRSPLVIDDCGARSQACAPTFLKCTPCLPNELTCDGTDVLKCDAEGQKRDKLQACDIDKGFACRRGGCVQLCEEATKNKSNVGCEYWPVPLANTAELSSTTFDFRVVVANPSPQAATVHVTRGGATVADATIPPGGLEAIVLPWIEGQSFAIGQGSWTSLLVADGAYRLRSDVPVIATQYNPFEYMVADTFSYTNDASLLLPAHALTGRYVGMSWVPLSRRTGTVNWAGSDYSSVRYPGYLAIVGVSPTPTTVTLAAAGAIQADVSGLSLIHI